MFPIAAEFSTAVPAAFNCAKEPPAELTLLTHTLPEGSRAILVLLLSLTSQYTSSSNVEYTSAEPAAFSLAANPYELKLAPWAVL